MPTRKVWDNSPKGYHWEEYDGQETWQEQEARRPRALRAARLEAHMIWEGHNPRLPENLLRLALAYRPDQQEPTQTYKRWRRQPEAHMLLDQELNRLAQDHGITRASVMQQLADLPTEMSTDTGKIEALKMQARLVDVPVERQSLAAQPHPRGMAPRTLRTPCVAGALRPWRCSLKPLQGIITNEKGLPVTPNWSEADRPLTLLCGVS